MLSEVCVGENKTQEDKVKQTVKVAELVTRRTEGKLKSTFKLRTIKKLMD